MVAIGEGKLGTGLGDIEDVGKLREINEALQQEIKRLKRGKKYGLVWEDKVEELDKKGVIPLLELREDLSLPRVEGKPNNYLIEGDNYHALKALQFTHKGMIDVIYIDPPYNTGNGDFVYNDSYVDKEDGFRHSKWLSFMSKRIKLARELLSGDGVIFVSIDENEQAQLKLLMDSIFGEQNFVSNIVWKKGGGKSDSKFLSNKKEYCLVYKKQNLKEFNRRSVPEYKYPLEDENGKYANNTFCRRGLTYTPSLDYPILAPDGTYIYPGWSKEEWLERQEGKHKKTDWRWTLSEKEFENRKKLGLIVFNETKDGWRVYYKSYMEGKVYPYEDIYEEVGTQRSYFEIRDIFHEKVFDYSKPTEYIKWLVRLYPSNRNVTVLDFFAGSGTTGQAVMELNEEDEGNRAYILCTNNEVSSDTEQSYIHGQGLIKRNIKTEFNKYRKDNEIVYEQFLNSIEYEELGIARAVTRERIKRVIEGYTTPKGVKVEGLPNNLTYLQTHEFPLEQSKLFGRRKLVNLSLNSHYLKYPKSEFTTVVVDVGFELGTLEDQKSTKPLVVFLNVRDTDTLRDYVDEIIKKFGNEIYIETFENYY